MDRTWTCPSGEGTASGSAPGATPARAEASGAGDGIPENQDGTLDHRWQIIAAKIESAAYWLQRRGGLVPTTLDGRPAWVIRYVRRGVGDRPKQASIFVCRGDCPELLDRVRRRLDLFRAEGEWVASLPRLARVVGKLARSAREATKD